MEFDRPLREARLLRRYKRFLADAEFADTGEACTVHCPNTGAMTGCAEPGSRVWLSHSDNPRRRYAWTWELVETADGTLVGIHTGRTNAIVGEALEAGRIPELAGYCAHRFADRDAGRPAHDGGLRREARYPDSRSRADFLLDGEPPCWVEVKNVTAAVSGRRAVFPDAVSARASAHMRMLAGRRRAGDAAVLVFCVQRGDVDVVAPAREIDPAYAEALAAAAAEGVQVLAWGASVTPEGIRLDRPLEVDIAG
ncbi:DNA/RNA nuclease SfsA [Lentisalinibacter orientalis]|uniref:DNA/RNA nuclease SfsA n=1 Tax=Lentisalinibacter orientalis TaxID=2992241 RepID=UPI003866D78A